MNYGSIGSLPLARTNIEEGRFTLAIENYFEYFQRTPKLLWDAEGVKEFVNLLCDMRVFILLQSVAEEVWNTLYLSMDLFPDEWRLLNVIADIYYQYAYTEAFAKNVFRGFKIAKKNNESCLAIEKKILNVMWTELPRWHFRMLNGKIRNASYQKAICKALNEGYTTALDIGAGCGLLSLYLGTHPSKPKITLFESNKLLYDLSILNLEKYCPEITVDGYRSDSKDVSQIRFKSNLLVTEIFDVAVFGEGILSTLLHSFEYHMKSNDFCIIPAKVNIFVTGVTCKNLDRKFRLHNKIQCLHFDENIHVVRNLEDPYDAENILGENFDILTETTEIIELHFHERETVESIYRNEWRKCISLKGLKNGIIDCLIVWFDLHLNDEIVISTNPFHSQNEPCWEQAVFHCPIPLKIDKEEELSLSVNIIEERLQFESTDENFTTYLFEVEESLLPFMNDEKWTEYLISLSEMIREKEQLTIFDFSCFPLIGLLLAKKGHRVVHVFKNPENIPFLEYLMKNNGIDPNLFGLVQLGGFPACALGQSEVDYVFYEPCGTDGSLNPSPFDNILFKKFNAKSFFSHVILNFKLIFSTYLDYCNRVSVEKVEPFDELARNMNIFSGAEQPFLPFNFPHESMSNETKWDMEQDSTKILPLKVSKDGKINAILIWFTLVGLGGIEFSTKESTYFNLNVLFLPERNVEKEESLNVYCQYESGGFFKLEICEEEWLKTNFATYYKYNPSIEKFYSTYVNNYLGSDDSSDSDDTE